MGKLSSSIVERAYRSGMADTYELSILLGVDSSSYMLVDSQRSIQLVETFSHVGELGVVAWTKMVAESKVLQQQYRQVHVGWGGIRQTLVPARLYQAEKQKIYIEHLTTLPAIEDIAADYLADFMVWNVYAFDGACKAAVLRNFPHARLFHLHTALLPLLKSGKSEDRVLAHYDGSAIRIFAFKDDRLAYANSFSCPHARDVLYYLLLVFKQQQFKPAVVPVYLLGKVMRDSEIYRLLYRYLANLTFLPKMHNFILGEKLANLPAHLYTDLMAIQQVH